MRLYWRVINRFLDLLLPTWLIFSNITIYNLRCKTAIKLLEKEGIIAKTPEGAYYFKEGKR